MEALEPLEGDPAEASLESQDPFAAIAVTLHLQALRSQYLIGKALGERFPSEDDFQAFLASPVYLESVEELAYVVEDIKSLGLLRDAFAPDAVAKAAAQHHTRALEAVELVAEELEVDPHDLVSVLITA